MRARLIYNPTSGHETSSSNVAGILDVIEEAGYETSAYRTTAKEYSARDEATRVAKDGFELIVVAGGDGTINEVVSGIAESDHRPKLAIIPTGTTNDYARALKIPRQDPVEAAKVVLKNQTIPMDIGKANDHYFINIAAGGSLTELTYEVNSQYKTILGYLAYLVKGAELLPRVKPIDMEIEYDSGRYNGKVSLFFIALTNSIGGIEKLVPDKEFGDGNFALIIVKDVNLREMIHLIALALQGKHLTSPKVIYTKTKNVKVKPTFDDRIMINLDGEYGGDAPTEFVNLQKHIDVFANVDDISKKNITKKEAETEQKIISEEESLD